MRSPFPTPGRNRTLENIWSTLTGFFRGSFTGSQRPRARQLLNNSRRDNDLEIPEAPIRDVRLARELIEMRYWCPEIATAADIVIGSVFSSEDGDDQGFSIADTLDDDETPVDPEVAQILRDMIKRVIPGSTLDVATERMLCYGDAFGEISISRIGGQYQIDRMLMLPTWEIFRIESDQGELLGFEQRKRLNDEQPLQFHPAKIVHWRYRRDSLYGRSWYREAAQDWARLKDASFDLSKAARAIGVNPTVFKMPPGINRTQYEEYKQAYREELADGAVTELFLLHDEEASKLASSYPDLKALIETVQYWRSRIAMRLRIPPWLLGLPTQGAREISGQPALEYARFINRVRGCLTEGIDMLCHTELILKGIPPERRQFRLVWPVIYTNPNVPQTDPNTAEGPNPAGVKDLDMVYVSNGNGKGIGK